MYYLSSLSRKAKRLKSVMEDKALNNGLIEGHQDYTKFIILCRSRVGSNLLLNYLQSHPNIRLFYELFSPKLSKRTYWDFVNYDLENVYRCKQEDPKRFISEFVYREMPKSVLATGFKIFYYHAQDDQSKPVWHYLQDMRTLKVIHLKRRNLLKTFLSQQVAFKTQSWIGKKNTNQVYPLELDYNLALQCFQETHRWEKEYEKFFTSTNILNIYYEDLVKNLDTSSRELQKFLGVTYKPLFVSTKKQSSISLPQAISNYFDLKEKFRKTPWSEYFIV